MSPPPPEATRRSRAVRLRDRAVAAYERLPVVPGKRTAGFAIGLALFAAALWAVTSQRGTLDDAIAQAADAPLWLVIAVIAMPVINVLIISQAFHALTRRYGDVRRGEMAAVVSSAWLLNYLPMRVGMIGRFAYHKKCNGIRVTDSLRILVESMALSAAAVLLLFAIAALVRFGLGDPPAGVIAAILIAPLIGGAFASLVFALPASPRHRPGIGARCIAWTLRYADAAIWVARYAAVFAMIGKPISLEQAVIVAAVGQAALMVPISGNGLGIREWAVGFTAEAGLVADVLNRAAELSGAIVAGLIGGWVASRNVARGVAAGQGA